MTIEDDKKGVSVVGKFTSLYTVNLLCFSSKKGPNSKLRQFQIMVYNIT